MCLLLLSAAPAPYLELAAATQTRLFWGSWLSLSLLSLWPKAQHLSPWLCPLLGGLMLLAAAALHLGMSAYYTLAPMPWANTVLLLSGSLLCGSAALMFHRRPDHPECHQ